jgi:hypothetical protein
MNEDTEPLFSIDLHFIKGVMFGFELVTDEDFSYFVLDLFILRIMFIR